MYDSVNPATPAVTHTFNLKHPISNTQLGITSPVPTTLLDNAMIDLAGDQNFASTDSNCGPPVPTNSNYGDNSGNPTAACFSATTNTTNSINWTAQLNYKASHSQGSITDPSNGPATFSTKTGVTQNEVYQNEGGQIQITAKTTAADGSSIEDCTVAYLEGPAGGIPDSSITSVLDTLYGSSQSYPTDGTATSNLMTGVAEKETSYRQFATPGDSPANSDLWNLDATYGILAKWPYENPMNQFAQRGDYIGLMQMATASNQLSDPNAWKWQDSSPMRKRTPTTR